jgi:hypothetical protein
VGLDDWSAAHSDGGHGQGMADDAIRSARPFVGSVPAARAVVAGSWIACG